MTIAVLPRDQCPVCACRLRLVVIVQRALFRHGGYGAQVRSTVRSCPECGWHLEAERNEVRPT